MDDIFYSETILLKLTRRELAKVCAEDPFAAKICSSKKFVAKYNAKHGSGISVTNKEFVPKTKKALIVPKEAFVPIRIHPKLPVEHAPDGYQVIGKWHWGFEIWAGNILHYKGHSKGEVPHFNIQSTRPHIYPEIFHVYIDPNTSQFLVINEMGLVISTY